MERVAASATTTAAARLELTGVSVIPDEHIRMGGKIGGRALRNWYEADIFGTKVTIAIQKDARNPPLEMVRRSLQAYSSLHHPNLVELLGVTDTGDIITELCDYDLSPKEHKDRTPSSLKEKGEGAGAHLSRHSSLGLRSGRATAAAAPEMVLLTKLRFARDIAKALAWAHGLHVIHRDVKPAHWLVSGTTAKLGGWMFAELQPEDLHPPPDDRFHGTPLYMAPELWSTAPFDGRKADVYSFGLSLWEVVTDRFVFAEHDNLEVFREAVAVKGERPPLSFSLSATTTKTTTKTKTASSSSSSSSSMTTLSTTSERDELQLPRALSKLLAKCWHGDPTRRPTMQHVLLQLNDIIAAIEVLHGGDDDGDDDLQHH
ncbi:Leucine-rich repeat receptor kinase EMS1 [Balamuthia mandrillaris]